MDQLGRFLRFCAMAVFRFQGTIVARLRLAYNATKEIAQKRALKEKQIEEMITRELEEKRRTWDVTNGEFQRFQKWYINYRKNLWHKLVYSSILIIFQGISLTVIVKKTSEYLPNNTTHICVYYTYMCICACMKISVL